MHSIYKLILKPRKKRIRIVALDTIWFLLDEEEHEGQPGVILEQQHFVLQDVPQRGLFGLGCVTGRTNLIGEGVSQ